ncbi:MAG: M3 family oligoendopeptidase [Alphaproteobacteria bacterium]|nr:M3 family oligoendopeptidase [Alphaproteobacteria bacterium]
MPDRAATTPLGPLPEWDLTDLYPGMDSPQLEADLATAKAEATALAERYRGKLASLDGAGLAAAIGAYERLDERLSRIMSYAQLVHAGNVMDNAIGRFYQSTQERVTDISAITLFFGLELNRIDDATMARHLADPALAHYAPWIRDSRAYRPHQLSDEVEQVLHEKQVVGRAALVRLFDETLAHLRIPFNGKDLTETEILDLMVGKDATVRRDASKAFGKALAGEVRNIALVTNMLAKDKEIEDRFRKFGRPISSRNLSNRVEDEVVDALIAAVQDNYGRLSHRYYALKARWFGVEKLDYWDRNAPLPEASDRLIPWDEARTVVLGAYGAFSPDLAAVGKQFFDKPWIDAPPRPGKSPGAFAHPTVPSAHPYLLVNYQGKVRDVMTLAHELGHGCHQVLAGAQGHFLSDTPLTLAETASVFGEMLTFQALLKAETDPVRRKVMLASKVEDMLNTVVRQIALHSFEAKVHEERRNGELSPERLGDIWLEVQTASLGPALRFDDDYRHFWAYIPHFIHSAFYVYAYAFGDCLVNSLYAVYEHASAGFVERYLAMLSAGGTKHYTELLKPFGLDARDPAFWQGGLSVIEGLITELEGLG